ncbi:putative aspartic-type endopeptidase [Paramyrothecium foliicola]|nr:putative aspartic-type endopeptidase [Paramyrothecium foliicola]
MRFSTILGLALVVGVTSGVVAPLHRRDVRQNPSPITATLNSFWFDVEVRIGSQTFWLLVDTGSSDTWVAETGYTCVDAENNLEVPQEECRWSPTYDTPPSTRHIANQTFGVKYGTGIALGRVAFEDVTLGGITVPRQTIGLVDRTTDHGDGINSGILGLGFPTLTSAHPGSENSNDTISLLTNRAIYDPLFVSMYKRGLVEPWYSIVINRLPRNVSTGPGGWLGLGELPPVSHDDTWAVAPIEITEGIPSIFYQRGRPEISLMTLTVDAVSWGSSSSPTTNTTRFQAVVDSGNPMNLFPHEIANSINSQFDPPAIFTQDEEIYTVDCNAKAPALGVTIDGHTFWHQPGDLIAQDHATGLCYSTIGTSAEGFGVALNFLGDAFMKNVVSVFDFGKEEMRFAARTEPQSSVSVPAPTPPASGGGRIITHPCLYLCLFGTAIMDFLL